MKRLRRWLGDHLCRLGDRLLGPDKGLDPQTFAVMAHLVDRLGGRVEIPALDLVEQDPMTTIKTHHDHMTGALVIRVARPLRTR